MNRRTFLSWLWKGMAAGLVVEGAYTTYDFIRPRISAGFGTVVPAGKEAGVREGQPPRYFPDGRFYLDKVEGEILALYQKCPHLGCRVPFCESSDRFECPCHGSIFNRKGEYIAGPAPRGMDSFRVIDKKGALLVDTTTVIEGPPRRKLTFEEKKRGPSCLKGVEHEMGPSAPEKDHGHEEDHGDTGGGG